MCWFPLHKMAATVALEDCSANNKQPFLFLLYPLGDLSGALYQGISVCVGFGDTIKFKQRGHPTE